MPSVWIERRKTASDRSRYVVKYRLGGRESSHRYAGSFAAKRDAIARRSWVAGELSAMRVPNITPLQDQSTGSPTVTEACERWRAARVDVTESTRVLHHVALGRVVAALGDRRLDQVTVDDVNALVVELARAGRKRETIRKSVKYRPRCSRRTASSKPGGRQARPSAPRGARRARAADVRARRGRSATSGSLLPASAALARLVGGARVSWVKTALAGDYDEHGRRARLPRLDDKDVGRALGRPPGRR